MKVIKNRKGFTLIELMAVIVVLSIIMVVAIPTVLNSMNNAKISHLQNTSSALSNWLTKQYTLSDLNYNLSELNPKYSTFVSKYGDFPNSYESAIKSNKSLSTCSRESYEMLSASGISNPESNIDLGNSYVWKDDDRIEVRLAAKVDGEFYIRSYTNVSYSDVNIITLSDTKIYGNSIQSGTPSPGSPVEIESVGDKTNNLFDKDNSNNTSSYYLKKDGTIGSSSSWSYSDYIKIKGDSITISADNSKYGVLGGAAAVCFYDQNKNFISGIEFNYSRDYVIYEVPKKASFIRCSYRTSKPQYLKIEQGSNATDYEPYGKYKIPITVSNGTTTKTTNIFLDEPLRKIGNYVDYIDIANGKVVRNVGEYIFTGSEEWKLYTTNNVYQFYISEVVESVNKHTLMSNIASTGGTVDTRSSFPISTYTVASGKGVAFNVYGYSTSMNVNEFKQFVAQQYESGKPVMILYPLASSSEENITLSGLSGISNISSITVRTEVHPIQNG